MARDVATAFRAKIKDVTGWQASYGSDRFGYFLEGKVPAVVKSLLSPPYINIAYSGIHVCVLLDDSEQGS